MYYNIKRFLLVDFRFINENRFPYSLIVLLIVFSQAFLYTLDLADRAVKNGRPELIWTIVYEWFQTYIAFFEAVLQRKGWVS